MENTSGETIDCFNMDKLKLALEEIIDIMEEKRIRSLRSNILKRKKYSIYRTYLESENLEEEEDTHIRHYYRPYEEEKRTGKCKHLLKYNHIDTCEECFIKENNKLETFTRMCNECNSVLFYENCDFCEYCTTERVAHYEVLTNFQTEFAKRSKEN